jgi:hypothetical protein
VHRVQREKTRPGDPCWVLSWEIGPELLLQSLENKQEKKKNPNFRKSFFLL